MSVHFTLPRQTLQDGDGAIVPGGTVEFFAVGTTTPLTVYSDSALTTPILQPIEADSAGRLPKIYPPSAFKVVVKDADGNTVYTEDDCDPGLSSTSGALAVSKGGTGATTAAGARTALGAAAQSELDTVSSTVSDLQQQVSDVGGTLGALAGLDAITRDHLDTGFGVVLAKDTLVDSKATVVTCSGTIPYDDSIPQISEGTQILSGSYTPASASSVLEIEIALMASASAAQNGVIGLFRDTGADAIAAMWQRYDSGNPHLVVLKHRMASWGTTPSTLQVRGGLASGTLYVNGNASGTRVGGGVLLAYMRVKEWLTY